MTETVLPKVVQFSDIASQMAGGGKNKMDRQVQPKKEMCDYMCSNQCHWNALFPVFFFNI